MGNKELNNEIQKRLKSNNWDYSIAGIVLKKKKNQRKKYFAYSGSVFAFSIMVVVVLNLVVNNDLTQDYDALIIKQINGTVEAVYGKQNESNNLDLINAETDQIIENALALRN
jgi:hypothetical protein